MGRAPCCDKANVKKGPWSPEEDSKLKDYIDQHGTGGNWIALPQKIGLKRCGKSCRLRWLNYLRPNIKHGGFSEDEDNLICSLYVTIGSRWSIIAAQLPGRTDNDIKNYWNTKLKRKLLGKQRKEQNARLKQQPMKQESTYYDPQTYLVQPGQQGLMSIHHSFSISPDMADMPYQAQQVYSYSDQQQLDNTSKSLDQYSLQFYEEPYHHPSINLGHYNPTSSPEMTLNNNSGSTALSSHLETAEGAEQNLLNGPISFSSLERELFEELLFGNYSQLGFMDMVTGGGSMTSSGGCGGGGSGSSPSTTSTWGDQAASALLPSSSYELDFQQWSQTNAVHLARVQQ